MPNSPGRASPADSRVPTLAAGKGERTREKLLHAAARVLAERGYAGTTMAEIAESAGTQAGSLYYHFASREELIEAVMRRGVSLSHENTKAVLGHLAAHATPGERLRAAIRAHVRFQVEVSDFGRAAARSTKQVPEDVQARVVGAYREYGALFDGLIRSSIAAQEIHADVDPSALRMLIIGAANWIPEWYQPTGSSSADRIADLLVRMVFDGVGVRRVRKSQR